MKILIAPFSSNGQNVPRNPKNWLYWPELVAKLHDAGHTTTQCGEPGDMEIGATGTLMPVDLKKLGSLFEEHDTFLSVDTWLHHAATMHGFPGIVIWSVTDPNIYGSVMHTNLLPENADLSKNQYAILPGIVAGLSKSEADRPRIQVSEVLRAVEVIEPKCRMFRVRQRTGAGLMDCKKALVDSGGDIEKAVEVLGRSAMPRLLGRPSMPEMPKPGTLKDN